MTTKKQFGKDAIIKNALYEVRDYTKTIYDIVKVRDVQFRRWGKDDRLEVGISLRPLENEDSSQKILDDQCFETRFYMWVLPTDLRLYTGTNLDNDIEIIRKKVEGT